MLKSARSERKTLTEIAEQELRQAITQGTFRRGSQLPTEAELCQMLGVSRTVVREALRVLEEDGLVARRHGVGTFVRDHPILKNLNFNFGITEMIESAGLTSGTSHLAIQSETADHEKAEQLGVALGTPLVTVERVRTADGRPVVYSLDTLAESLMQRVGFDPQPAPSFDQQLDGIALDARLDAKLHERALGRVDAAENLLDDAVFVVLRVDLEPVTQKPLRIGIARLRQRFGPETMQVHLHRRGREIGDMIQRKSDLAVCVHRVLSQRSGSNRSSGAQARRAARRNRPG